MAKEGLKFVLVCLMGALLAGYFYLNAGKIAYLAAQLEAIGGGEPADAVTLLVDGVETASYQVPSSGIFDTEGSRQLSFHSLTARQYDELGNSRSKLTVRLNGVDIMSTLITQPEFFVLVLPEHKLYLIRDDYVENIAVILLNERMNRRGIFHCVEESVCSQIAFRLGGQWGPSVEPLLESDLPRGRWSLGPAAELSFFSDKDLKILATFYLLTPFPEQEVTIQGAPVMKLYPVTLDRIGDDDPVDDRYYARVLAAELRLRPGENDIAVAYSHWIDTPSGDRPPLAAYVTGIEIDGIR